MDELKEVFINEIKDGKAIIKLPFGKFFNYYKEATGKLGLSTFYGFLRENISLGLIKKGRKGFYFIDLSKYIQKGD